MMDNQDLLNVNIDNIVAGAKKRKKKRKRILVTIGVSIVFIAAIIVGIINYIDFVKISNAQKLIEQGSYSAAIEYLEKLEQSQKVKELVSRAYYELGREKLLSGDVYEGTKAFYAALYCSKGCELEEDIKNLVDEQTYENGIKYMSKEDYEHACKIFSVSKSALCIDYNVFCEEKNKLSSIDNGTNLSSIYRTLKNLRNEGFEPAIKEIKDNSFLAFIDALEDTEWEIDNLNNYVLHDNLTNVKICFENGKLIRKEYSKSESEDIDKYNLYYYNEHVVAVYDFYFDEKDKFRRNPSQTDELAYSNKKLIWGGYSPPKNAKWHLLKDK